VQNRPAASGSAERAPAIYSTVGRLSIAAVARLKAWLLPGAGMRSACEKPPVRAKGQQCPQASHLLRAVQRHAVVPVVFTYCVAVSACERGPAVTAGRTSLTSDAAPSGRLCSRTVRGSVRAKRTSGVSRPYISHDRCSAMPSSRMGLRAVRPSARLLRRCGAMPSGPTWSPIALASLLREDGGG